jgi:hypothetical protein
VALCAAGSTGAGENANSCQVTASCACGSSCVCVWLLLTGMGLRVLQVCWIADRALTLVQDWSQRGADVNRDKSVSAAEHLICLPAWHVTLLSECCCQWLAD